MKIRLALFALSFSLFAHAQPPGVKLPQPITFWNLHTNPWMFSPHEDANEEVSKEHLFRAVMKDSTSLIVRGRIQVDSASYYLSWVDKSVKKKDSARIKKIYPGQTCYISVLEESGSPRILGPATEDGWLFPVIQGQLTVYAPFAEKDLPEVFFLFVRNGDGPVTEMTMDNLANLLQGNKKAFEFLKKGKIRKAIEKFNE